MDNDDGLILNLTQNSKINKKKKKTINKSRKLFIKKRINQKNKNIKSTDKPKIRIRKEKIVKDVDQQKEISTIQDEFSSGLDNLNRNNKLNKNVKSNDNLIKNNKPKLNNNLIKNDNSINLEINNSTNLEINNSTKNDKYKSNKNEQKLKHDNDYKQDDKSINQIKLNKDKQINLNNKNEEDNHKSTINLNETTIINDEFSDGLMNDFKNKSINLKRKFENDKKDFKSKKFNRSNYPSTSKHNTDELKDDFNKLFASKNNINDKYNEFKNNKVTRDELISGKKEFISDCFKYNPEIPEIKLKNIVDENKEDVFSNEMSFESFNEILHPHLISCISNRLNMNKMTNVQFKSIPLILERNDCLIKSVTGSGKTLAYCVPIIQLLQDKTPKLTRSDGIHALIIVPTRELVLQCYNLLESLCNAFTFIVPGYLMGGENKHSEKNRIRKGINILVSTPGRLLDHIATTKNLILNRLELVVIDEADRMYEAGFEESIKNILSFVNEEKDDNHHIQTILLSATLSSGVKNLAGLILKDAKLIDTFDDEIKQKKYTFPRNLKQHFCLVPAKLRLLTLASFIFNKCSYERSSKILIFVSTQDIVDFHYDLFQTKFNEIIKANNQESIDFFKLHGNMEQKERMKIFQKFKDTSTGVLISTDVAARGLDLKEIEFVVQYTCPSTIEDYIHRIGRTARIEHNGSSLIFLLPSEINFLKHIQKELEANLIEMKAEDILKVLSFFNFGQSKSNKCFREHASKLQFEFESAVHNDEDGKLELARKAYLSFVRAYATYPRSTKAILPFKELHLGHLCKSFGLRDAPRKLAGFKMEFISKTSNNNNSMMKRNHRSDGDRFNSNYSKNKNTTNKKMIPIENRVSEFF